MGSMRSQIEHRLTALEHQSELEEPLILDFIFTPVGIRRSRFRFKWENHNLVMWEAANEEQP